MFLDLGQGMEETKSKTYIAKALSKFSKYQIKEHGRIKSTKIHTLHLRQASR